jgi:hypothetical protein
MVVERRSAHDLLQDDSHVRWRFANEHDDIGVSLQRRECTSFATEGLLDVAGSAERFLVFFGGALSTDDWSLEETSLHDRGAAFLGKRELWKGRSTGVEIGSSHNPIAWSRCAV